MLKDFIRFMMIPVFVVSTICSLFVVYPLLAGWDYCCHLIDNWQSEEEDGYEE